MMRVVVLALLLAGCATTAPQPVAVLPECPPRPAPLKPPPRVRTVPALLRFEVALELDREAQRDRGDQCAARAAALEGRR